MKQDVVDRLLAAARVLDGYGRKILTVGALKDVGLMYLKGEVSGKPDVPKAIKYLEKAAEHGQGQALFLLGEIYEQGRNGKVDKDRAIKYYKAAAIRHPDITKLPGEAAGAAASQSDPKRK